MLNWLFKRKPDVPEPKLIKGVFSTDFEFNKKENIALQLKKALARSFQKTSADFRQLNADGTAMDQADNDVTTAKSQNWGGNCINDMQLAYYASWGFIGYQSCGIIAQHWLVDKACMMPGKDAVRHGYEITSNDGTEVKPEIFDDMRKMDKAYCIKQHCVELVNKGRVFGIRIAMFVVDSPDPLYYEKPFNPDGITKGSYKGIVQIDPYWITPELDMEAAANPASLHFYEPTWWRINSKRYHRTHLVIFRTGSLVDILKPSYIYGGVPVPQKIMERVYAAERTANEAPKLAASKRMTVLKMDTAQIADSPDSIVDKLITWSEWMDNFGIKVIGGEEEVSQFDTGLADLDAVIMTQYQIVAAAAGVPATKLLGTTPKGFNATGEYEEASYHEELESIQEHDLTPLVERHHLLSIRSEIAPKHGIAPFSTEVNWKATDSPTAAEQAEINNKKADTDLKLSQAGAIDTLDIRKRLIMDSDSGYNGISPFVPGGPGDREAELEAKEAEAEATANKESDPE